MTAKQQRQKKHTKFPQLSGHKILYRGRRYIAFEVDEEHPFDEWEDSAQFLVWDGLYGWPLAVGKVSSNGLLSGELLLAHVDIGVDDARTMPEFILNTRKAAAYYSRAIGLSLY